MKSQPAMAALRGLRSSAQACSVSADAEVVHQLRVSVRTLRVYLRLFSKRVGRTKSRQLRKELRKLFLPLGQLRDLQLFDEALRHRLAPGAPGLVALRRRLQMRIRARARSVKTRVRSERFQASVESMAALVGALHQPKTRWFEHRLDKLHHRAVSVVHHLDCAQLDQLHTARKAIKKLRYASELGGDRFGKKRVRRYLRALKAVLGPLGVIVDLHVQLTLVATECQDRALRRSLTRQLRNELEERMAGIDAPLSAFAEAEKFWR